MSLIGPITVGSSFMLASPEGPSVLNAFYVTGSNGPNYYWESNLATLLSTAYLPVFTSGGTLDDLTLYDSINHGGITLSGNIIGNSNPPGTVRMSQAMYSNWLLPDIFLSGIPYIIHDTSGLVIGRIYTTPSITGQSVLASNIFILPVLWYSNCTSSGTYDVIKTPQESITNWMCTSSPKLPGCLGVSLISSGWTNLADCTEGTRFTYCPNGDVCGDNNCKGPCSSAYDDCDSSSKGFGCVFDPSKFFQDTKWWRSPYFIGIIGAFILIVSVIIIIVIFHRRAAQNY